MASQTSSRAHCRRLHSQKVSSQSNKICNGGMYLRDTMKNASKRAVSACRARPCTSPMASQVRSERGHCGASPTNVPCSSVESSNSGMYLENTHSVKTENNTVTNERATNSKSNCIHSIHTACRAQGDCSDHSTSTFAKKSRL